MIRVLHPPWLLILFLLPTLSRADANPEALCHYHQGTAALATRNIDGAIAEFTEAIRLDPKDPRPYGNRGYAYLVRQEYDRAIADFAADIALLQELTGESFGDWLRAAPRTYKGEVKPVGQFGTAYQSIDRPLGEHRDRLARSQGASPPSADP